jgi:hypothetical protein
MNRMIVVVPLLAAALGGSGCGAAGTESALTVPASVNSSKPLPKVEPVRGNDYEAQALQGAAARLIQWSNRHNGRTVLDASGNNSCDGSTSPGSTEGRRRQPATALVARATSVW